MATLRSAPPASLAGSPVVELRDIEQRISTDLVTGTTRPIDLPASNVLQFILADGSKISARPSGTEPKIKFYFSMKAPFKGPSAYAEQVREMEGRMKQIQVELGMA
jgi:phosphoglucomutase